ncbi:hypothetical protein FKP32DRAFT_1598533 [Trametes sanguinea]|nr:hypothetical protein FKP32DRAFT_1598533 [Trametes sanguinea]
MTGEHHHYGEGATTPHQETRTSIDRDHPRSPPMSPATRNRFIMEPQVLNAAFESQSGAKRDPAPSLPQSGGGLPPPPRPNSRKGKPSQSTPSSPAASIDHSIASLPNSPTSSPYSNNSPNTPGSSDASPSVKPSPRLSNFLRGESLVFSMRRRSSVENESGAYDQKEEAETQQTTWSPREMGEGVSPLDSVPSSPELLASPADGSRPSRQNRYLTGLQKITKLGRSKGTSLNALADAAGVPNPRRMSDAALDARRSQDKTGVESGRAYRRLAGSIGKMAGAGAAGDLIKQPSSVPSSPIAPPTAKGLSSNSSNSASRPIQEQRRGSVPSVMGGLRRPSFGGGVASATGWTSATNPGTGSNRPNSTHGRPSMSADRESFIDLASPTFSPFSAEFHDISIPQQQQQQQQQSNEEQQNQPTTNATFYDDNDFNHGESPSRTTKPRLPRLVPPAGSEKPPIPTTPKPDFSRRSRSGQSSAGKQSKSSSGQHAKHGGPLSTFATDLDRGLSTRNELTPRERAQRVRTTHKLTQVFGQTPGVSPVSPDRNEAQFANGCMPMPTNITLNLNPKRKHQHHRPAVSMSDEVITPVYGPTGELVWPPPEGTRYVSLAARRHSAPLSPDEFSFMVGRRSQDSNASSAVSNTEVPEGSIIEIGSAEGVPDDRRSVATSRTSRTRMSEEGPGSPTSFMDLSDEEGAGDDGLSEVFAATPRGPRAARRDEYGLGAGALSDSLSLSSEQVAEEERRRKREKLAKLHRFLGSRVPQHLVLGPLDEGAPLPPPAPSPSPTPNSSDSPSSPAFRFTQSGSGSKPKKKNGGRPGTSDSSKPLMGDSPEPGMLDPMRSSVYMHYRHSLNSLNDIIDRDDRESLAELHDYLSGHQFDHFSGPSSPGAADDLSVVATPTVKAERRRSLPARASIASFTSELSFVVAPTPTEPSFQQRRRRAAKLTHFFGVDYPQLMNEILDSIEKGLEEERGKGTLRPDEVKDLQQKLVSLKTKRNSLRR